jgi:hypothetical protein
MKPSTIVISVLIFIGVMMIFNQLIVDMTTNFYVDTEVNNSALLNYTNKYSEMNTQIINNQDEITNSTLQKIINSIFPYDSMLSVGVRSIDYLWSSLLVGKQMLNDANTQLMIPPNILQIIILIIIALVLFGIVSIFMRADV